MKNLKNTIKIFLKIVCIILYTLLFYLVVSFILYKSYKLWGLSVSLLLFLIFLAYIQFQSDKFDVSKKLGFGKKNGEGNIKEL